MVFLTFTLQTCLSKMDMNVYPSKPCTICVSEERFANFCKHHLREDIPNDLNKTKWQKFITSVNTWNRRKQSFFPYDESKSVLSVCTSGGKIYNNNLCISKKPISFYTVEISGKKVKNVIYQTKHVILACDKISNQCLPDHFQANTKNNKPDTRKPDCSKSRFILN